ncbi:MAG: ribonuclease III [Lachnospiraceae bacterium]|nr:ribonuclease III [Lachnospiraceae bacterium]
MNLEERIGYKFKNKELLRLALTHSSYVNEHKLRKEDCNERLEFLGDAILEMVTSEYFYKAFPDKMEGELSKIRSTLVCERALAVSAREIDLGHALIFGKGMDKESSRENENIISDAFEALIAAIFLDSDLDHAKDLIYQHVLNDMDFKMVYNDAKTALQEKLQAKGLQAEYRLMKEEGPDHEKRFTVKVFIDGKPYAEASGSSKKHAEQVAAMRTFTMLD